MFIQTEPTPNPASLKFLPGRDVLGTGTAEYRSADEAGDSPLAERLFALSNVGGVFFGADFITVTKTDGDWPHLKPIVLGAIIRTLHVRHAGGEACPGGLRWRRLFRG